MMATPDIQTTETLRRRAWWRAVCRRRLTPAEISLIVIDGDRDRDGATRDEVGATSLQMKGNANA